MPATDVRPLAAAPPAPDAPVRVLIVEDEVIVAMELQSHLEARGYHVIDAVTSGTAAVACAHAHGPDLVMMDVNLEGAMDGIEAAGHIRRATDPAVVFLTAFGDEETIGRAKAVGASGYLIKPFDERELHATIEVALQKHRAQRRLQESHDDLAQILDGLRLGTVMTDEAGRVTFLSRAARHLLGLPGPLGGLGERWDEAFPFPPRTLRALGALASGAVDGAEKVAATVEQAGGARYWMEVEVQRDPRARNDEGGRHIFVFYDVTEVHALREQLKGADGFAGILGASREMQAVFHQIQAVARVNSTVLIEGATGTGKELVARAIHDRSPRRRGPFVAVNCAALTEALAASQLFGHKKGAFTGAVTDHDGFFGAAHGGTLFLDEIGDVPLDVQVNLLRVLEQRAVTRIGETQPRPVDVRIVAASHRRLPEEVAAGRFRQDLLYRIRVARVELPPLRQRQGDVPLLVQRFLAECAARMDKRLTDVSHDAMRALLEYDWPGNVRELRNVVEYAAIRARGAVLRHEDLPPEVRAATAEPLADEADTEEGRIHAALRHTGGNRKEAAKLLGISRATFYRRLAEYGIE